MFLRIWLCTVCILKQVNGASQFDVQRDVYTNDLKQTSSYTAKERFRRSLPAAINDILKTAILKFSTSEHKVFYKQGGHRDAVKDFKKLHPEVTHREKDVIKGVIGDWTIKVIRPTYRPKATTRIYQTYDKNGIQLKRNQIVIEYYGKNPTELHYMRQ